jgi:hypothetical protein
MKKSGMQMTISTIVVILLSIVVLVLLLFYLNSQTGIFNRFIKTQSGESNVDTIVTSCNSLVEIESLYSYCCEEKEVVLGGDADDIIVTCNEAADLDWSGERIDPLDCSATVCAE